jgi:hypothetical protein
MPDASVFGLVLLAGCGAVTLAVLHHRHLARVRDDRGSLFDDCAGILTCARVTRRGLNFPVLVGRRGTAPVRVEPVVDTLSMRTVPVLWLVVTVGLPRPAAVHLSVLARTCGTEFYSRHHEAGARVQPDPGWPESLSVRCDRPEQLSTYAGLLDRLAEFMADGQVKQVALSGATARVVWRCGAAVPSTYRVTRRVDLTGVRADPQAVGEVLDMVLELATTAGRRAVAEEVAE